MVCVFLLIVAVVCWPRVHAAGMMGVGSLMGPSSDASGGGGSGAAILTESSSILTTEAGSPLRTE